MADEQKMTATINGMAVTARIAAEQDEHGGWNATVSLSSETGGCGLESNLSLPREKGAIQFAQMQLETIGFVKVK